MRRFSYCGHILALASATSRSVIVKFAKSCTVTTGLRRGPAAERDLVIAGFADEFLDEVTG